jgi:hypothetical protein
MVLPNEKSQEKRQKLLKNILNKAKGEPLAKACLQLLITMEFLHVAKKYVRRKAIWCERSFVLSFL